jgi:hypothetical protein
MEIAGAHGVEAARIGKTAGVRLTIRNRGAALIDAEVEALKKIWEGALERLLEGGPVQT